jgi:hypothetical protein
MTTAVTGLLVWGFFCQGVLASTAHLSSVVSLFDLKARFFVPTRHSASRRAQELSRLVASSATTRRPWALTVPSTAAPSNAVGARSAR